MKITRHLPNLLTSCNLLCGCFGIVAAMDNQPLYAALFVWIACGFDFLDGFAARALKVSSSIGKELDSLADVVSFGVLPAFVMYKMWPVEIGGYWPYVSFLIVVFSALRLAIFNIDETQRDSFKGLPTPANALLITALPLQVGLIQPWLNQPIVLITIIAVSSFLLVSRIELFALKLKNFSWKENNIRFIFLLLTVALLVLFRVSAIPLIILLYIGLSLSVKVFSK
jgi:CDP-diacylglycerol---serine O-phosphatidyltransferase